ncbi:hypothetical protein G8T76_10780 [Clostridium botulinum C/D]|uniref:hypothetical protein n=1 Tax=Clostridium botulinum TaxID=1491 RepID=UPI0002DCE81C|nr:hypothetical protein [Clostridium botulinum]KOA76882.1 hypothetical protein ADU78_05345 [Clostridium botulinum]KOA80927.1 hypothetical protein ADU77_00075 [Clostridium botulinum]KOA88953.1 hypothetical protein ADU75_00805 [Clostridium botulinum]KOC31856.1 hypothetical protein ADU83_12070 [Clostridium botulinum]KOC37936.1 hypothetical protein ADU82_05640 [Clostridium botulinum]
MINLTEIIKNQFKYGTMDKKELRRKVDVMYVCNAFTDKEYQEICNLFLEKEQEKKELEKTISIKENTQEHNEEFVTQ